MYCLIKDVQLFEFYEIVTISIKKEFDSGPEQNEKYVKSKIRSYNGKTNTNVLSNKISK